MISACPSLMCLFTKWANSLKNFVFDICVCFGICKFVSGLLLCLLGNLWFDDLCEEQIGDRLKFV